MAEWFASMLSRCKPKEALSVEWQFMFSSIERIISTTREEYMLKRLCLLATFFMASAAMASIEINKATEADLDALHGIGPATTQLILKERKKGEFKDWADLMHRVKGIGEARAAKLSAAGLTVASTNYKERSSKSQGTKSHAKSQDDKPATLTPAAVKPIERKSVDGQATTDGVTYGKP